MSEGVKLVREHSLCESDFRYLTLERTVLHLQSRIIYSWEKKWKGKLLQIYQQQKQ